MSRRIGYAWPTSERDRVRQRAALEDAGVGEANLFIDEPAQRARPQLRAALAQCRAGDSFVVPTIRVLGGTAREIHRTTSVLQTRGVSLDAGGTAFEPGDAVGEVFFTTIAMLAGAERTPTPSRRHTVDAKTDIKAGSKRRKATTLDEQGEQELIQLHVTGDYTATELASRFRISRSTVYRITERHAREHRNPD